MSSLPDLSSQTLLQSLRELLAVYGMRVVCIDVGRAIPGSYWGDSEAGLIEDRLYVRRDTPLHSALHEACHFVCMDTQRRAVLHTDAGGDIPEENAVCYLQGILADRIRGYDRHQLFSDMDGWGYTFRLGSALAWFDQDAADACEWLQRHHIIDAARSPTGRLRQ
jgi:hypothetical protein